MQNTAQLTSNIIKAILRMSLNKIVLLFLWWHIATVISRRRLCQSTRSFQSWEHELHMTGNELCFSTPKRIAISHPPTVRGRADQLPASPSTLNSNHINSVASAMESIQTACHAETTHFFWAKLKYINLTLFEIGLFCAENYTPRKGPTSQLSMHELPSVAHAQ